MASLPRTQTTRSNLSGWSGASGSVPTPHLYKRKETVAHLSLQCSSASGNAPPEKPETCRWFLSPGQSSRILLTSLLQVGGWTGRGTLHDRWK
ncbi:hypothetical protein INR49_007123 [Caranx melampygus]|nr:hypothetical protein INR49_007123 [Caranx melampygus]